jgi:Mg-chelatase subunit ChlD
MSGAGNSVHVSTVISVGKTHNTNDDAKTEDVSAATSSSTGTTVDVDLGDVASTAFAKAGSVAKRAHSKVKEGVTAFVLLDVSGSMSGGRLNAAKAAAAACFAAMHDEDRFSVATFDSEAFMRLKPRPVGQLRRQNELPALLERIFAQGQTALYDAIVLTVDQIRSKDLRNTITVLTDGEDNFSKHTLADVLAMLVQYPNISLDIVHIGENRVAAYDALVAERGTYVLVQTTTTIVKTTTQLFVQAYGKAIAVQ